MLFRSKTVILSDDSDVLWFRYERSKVALDAGFAYDVEFTDSLALWTSLGPGEVVAGEGDRQTVAVILPLQSSEGNAFARLRVTQP